MIDPPPTHAHTQRRQQQRPCCRGSGAEIRVSFPAWLFSQNHVMKCPLGADTSNFAEIWRRITQHHQPSTSPHHPYPHQSHLEPTTTPIFAPSEPAVSSNNSVSPDRRLYQGQMSPLANTLHPPSPDACVHDTRTLSSAVALGHLLKKSNAFVKDETWHKRRREE